LTEGVMARIKFPICPLTRWDEKAGLRRDALRSQMINVLEAQEKETGYAEE